MRLAKEGFAPLNQVLQLPADLVLAALEYSTFLSDYAETYSEMNQKK